MPTSRDEFSTAVKVALAKRAGYLCSNPDCRQLTIGAHYSQEKAAGIGEAAHISAAAERGPRFNSKLLPEERSAIKNGIWLCSSCATLIDKDELSFPERLLREWKGGVEAETKLKLRGGFKGTEPQLIQTPDKRPILEIDFTGASRGRASRNPSYKNPIKAHDQGFSYVEMNDQTIFHWVLHWRYQLVILNNSSYPAFNVKIDNLNHVPFDTFEQLPKINNIPALDKRELKVRYIDGFEGTSREAEEVQKGRYPASFDDRLLLKLTYYNEERKMFTTIVEFKMGKLFNKIQ